MFHVVNNILNGYSIEAKVEKYISYVSKNENMAEQLTFGLDNDSFFPM